MNLQISRIKLSLCPTPPARAFQDICIQLSMLSFELIAAPSSSSVWGLGGVHGPTVMACRHHTHLIVCVCVCATDRTGA